jgi:hypothetical protein
MRSSVAQHKVTRKQIEQLSRLGLYREPLSFLGVLTLPTSSSIGRTRIPGGNASMNDETTDRSQSAKPRSGGGQTLSPRDILVILTIIALACVGGYFLLMKLIDVSRQEDCVLAGGRNCAPIEVPSSR